MKTLPFLKTPKRQLFQTRSMLIIACAILLQACGGGGGDSTVTPAASPPVVSSSSAVTTTGVITGFGSVHVNGVEYETDSTDFDSDDDVADETELKVGQVVTLKGTRNDDGVTGTADSIEYEDLVKGPIASINGNTLVVLGYTIVVTDTTVFDDNVLTQSLAGLNVGDVVEVSGFFNATGEIVSTYLESKSPGGEFEVEGIVSNLDDNTSTFDVGSLIIDYSGATLEDFDGTALADGLQVEVEGSSFGGSGELIATKVELEDDDHDENDEVEIEGLITRFTSVSDFDVFGVAVTTTSGTEYENGAASDLAVDVRVEVEGTINASGVLVAEEVEFRSVDDTRLEAAVDSVDVNANQLVVLGITVVVNSLTQLEDDSDFDVRFFTLNDISAGDFVEVRGKLEDDGTISATRLERDDQDEETSVRGLVESNDGTTLVIAGVTIRTVAETEFEGADEESLGQAGFFSIALVGVEVEAEGLETATSEITASDLEIEDD